MDLYHNSAGPYILALIQALGVGTIVKLLWGISGSLGELKGQLSVLMTNHLPHIEAEIKDLRSDFTAHTSSTVPNVIVKIDKGAS